MRMKAKKFGFIASAFGTLVIVTTAWVFWGHLLVDIDEPLIIRAARRGDWDRVRELTSVQDDVLKTHGTRLLVRACYQGEIEAADYLIGRGVSVDESNDVGVTPLGSSIMGGQTLVAKLLLDRGCDVEFTGADGLTPLLQAVVLGQVEISGLLLEKQANPSARTPAGWTALHLAVRTDPPRSIVKSYDRRKLVALLIEHGADVNERNEGGIEWEQRHDSGPLGRTSRMSKEVSAIGIARDRGFVDIIDLLDEHGAR